MDRNIVYNVYQITLFSIILMLLPDNLKSENIDRKYGMSDQLQFKF